MKEDIKEYLIVNNLLTEEKLANHILELRRNTVVKPILHKLVDLLYNKKPVLLSFFAEKNKPKGILNFTEIEQNTIPKKEQEKLIKRHIKKSNIMFLDEFLERVEKQNNTDALSKAAQQKFKDWSLYVNLCNEDDILESLPNYEHWSTNTTKTFNTMSDSFLDRVKNDSDKCGILESMEFPFDLEQKEKNIFEDWNKKEEIDIMPNGMARGKIFTFQPTEQKVRVNFYTYDSKNNPTIEVREFDCPLKAGAYFRESKYTEAFVYEYGTFNLVNKWNKKVTANEGSEIHEKGNKMEGIKETEGKLHYELSWEFIEEMARRMANNKSDKYPLYNWKKNIDIEELKQAINRHHIEVMKGNYKDGDEIFGHIISYACNSMMLWEQLKNNG